MMIVCILMSLTIAFPYYLLPSPGRFEGFLPKLLFASVMGSAQIVMTELILGLAAALYLPQLILLNLFISAVIAITACKKNPRIAEELHESAASMVHEFKPGLRGPNLIVASLAALVYGWILLAAYLLPARGIDDLVYHLPSIFEYVQSHGIRLLPVAIRHHFAFPENAELLFMWPLMFTHEQQMVDCTNIPFVLLSVAAVFALLRHLKISRRNSLFASLLYALSPMVFMQAGANYIDLIAAFFFLVSLYFALLFNTTRHIKYLYATGVAIGMLCGMKYTAIFLVLALQILILPKLSGIKYRHVLAYFLLILTLCGWWYIRNAYIFGDPFYPLDILGIHGSGGSGILGNIRVNMKNWLLFYPLDDVGIGSFDGGFGLVFWGLGFPSWIFITAHDLINIRKTGIAKLVMLLQLPIGFLLLLTVPKSDVIFCGRFAMFALAIGLYYVCRVLVTLKDKTYVWLVKTVCIVLSVAEICLMSTSELPCYQLSEPINDKIVHKQPSEFRYFTGSLEQYAALRYVWEPLDLLTKDDKYGFNCHIASDYAFFFASPIYGSRLQNRIANFDKKLSEDTDAIVCMYISKNLFGSRLPPAGIKLLDNDSLARVVTDRNYLLATQCENGCLLLNMKSAKVVNKLKLLKNYYANTWPAAIDAARQITPLLSNEIPVVTSSEIGYGIRYLETGDIRTDKVMIIPEGLEIAAASARRLTKCYSLGKPLVGYTSGKVASTMYNNKTVDIYLNIIR